LPRPLLEHQNLTGWSEQMSQLVCELLTQFVLRKCADNACGDHQVKPPSGLIVWPTPLNDLNAILNQAPHRSGLRLNSDHSWADQTRSKRDRSWMNLEHAQGGMLERNQTQDPTRQIGELIPILISIG
jgi:hypothetical protein